MKEKEMVYVIPLREVYYKRRTKRANKAIALIKNFLKRHTKEENIKLDNSINEKIWSYSRETPPRRIKVKVKKEEDKVIAYLAE